MDCVPLITFDNSAIHRALWESTINWAVYQNTGLLYRSKNDLESWWEALEVAKVG